MVFLIPARVATALLGLICGYYVGFLFEIRSSTTRNYQKSMDQLLTNVYWRYCEYKYAHDDLDDEDETDYLEHVTEAFDHMVSDSSDCDTEYSE